MSKKQRLDFYGFAGWEYPDQCFKFYSNMQNTVEQIKNWCQQSCGSSRFKKNILKSTSTGACYQFLLH